LALADPVAQVTEQIQGLLRGGGGGRVVIGASFAAPDGDLRPGNTSRPDQPPLHQQVGRQKKLIFA
jgi:hypothetical protein